MDRNGSTKTNSVCVWFCVMNATWGIQCGDHFAIDCTQNQVDSAKNVKDNPKEFSLMHNKFIRLTVRTSLAQRN